MKKKSEESTGKLFAPPPFTYDVRFNAEDSEGEQVIVSFEPDEKGNVVVNRVPDSHLPPKKRYR